MCNRIIGLLCVVTFGAAVTQVGCREEEASTPGGAATASAARAAGSVTRPSSRPDTAPAAALPQGLDAEHLRKAKALLDGGAAYLLSRREDNGVWSAGRGAGVPAITSMVLKALVQHPDYGPDHPAVAGAFDVLLEYRQSDGGIYAPREGGGSYTSAVALMALTAAGKEQYRDDVQGLVAYLKGLQIVPGSKSADGDVVGEDDPSVGGVSYGKGPGRPDLSNVGMWTEALHDAGVGADDPAMQRVAGFITRLQNRSETNPMDWAAEGSNDGGFIYTFPGDGPGPARGARSYGSMTYTGFKSLLYAGVDRDDPRVRAAFDWIRRYWRLDGNPNMPRAQSRAGLYYYYHVFAKALRAWGEPVVTDAEGERHNWRHELIDVLADQVRPDGSWVNEASSRWWEGKAVLTTSYAMMALEEAVRP